MKAAIAISGLIVAVVVGLLVLQRRDQADEATDASADAMLVRSVLPADLPVLFDEDGNPHQPLSFARLLETCDRVGPVLTGGAEEDRAVASAELAEALLASLSMGRYEDGFIDDRIDASGVFADPLRRQFRQLSIALETHADWLIREGQAEEAGRFARAGIELGRRVFVQNVRLRGRQRGLGLMRAGLGQLMQATDAMLQADELSDAQASDIAEDVRLWEQAIAAIESAWNTKLQTISSAKPNVADLVRVAESDEDRSFRVFATHQLGFARFERGEPGNQAILADAIRLARESDDPLIRAAGEAAASMTREQFHTRERQLESDGSPARPPPFWTALPPGRRDMHLLLIGLFLGVFLHDLTATAMLQDSAGVWRQAEALPPDAWPGLGLAPVVCIVLLPKIVLLLGYAMLCRAALRRLGTKSGAAWIRRLEQVTTLLPMTLLVLYMTDLGAGALRWARVPFRHTVLIDELMVMLPTLLTLVVTWAIYYPLDRRMRESAMIGRIDRGLPIYTPPTRGQYLLAQLRHQVALLFVPLVMIAAWSESVTLLGPDGRGVFTATQAMLLVPAGALAVFSFAPLIIRHVWDTAPLPEGEIRRVMADLCRQHRVGVRELLVWRTYGVLVNAAVMGLVAPLRYILLSDALLDQMRRREVEAVMAHEIAHVRKHHMFWLLLVMVATLGLGEQAGQAALAAFDEALTRNGPLQLLGLDAQSLVRDERVAVTVVSAVSLLLALLVFGWVSRRAERQADVFAARHLAKTAAEPAHNEAGRVVFTPEASGTMIGALQRVAALNHIPTRRKMWRHGSIRWRQDHLRSLNGKPVDDAEIDRVFARVKFAAVAAVVALGVLYSRQWTDKPEAILVETYQTIAAWL